MNIIIKIFHLFTSVTHSINTLVIECPKKTGNSSYLFLEMNIQMLTVLKAGSILLMEFIPRF